MTTDEKHTLDNHPNLVDASEYIQKSLEDPVVRRAYEEESLKVDIAMRVHTQRKAKGLSQAGLAKMARTSQKVISRIEHAEVSVGVDLLQRVAYALGLKVTLTLG